MNTGTRKKKQKHLPPSTAQQMTKTDSMIELQGLLRTREELLRLSLTHYSTASSVIVFPLLFKFVVHDGMTLVILLTEYLKDRHQQTLSHDVEVHRKNYKNTKDIYEKLVADFVTSPEAERAFGKCNSMSEVAAKLDADYKNNPQASLMPLKNRFFNVLAALAAFSSDKALKPYLKQVTEKTSYLAHGHLELQASFLSPDVKSKNFASLSKLIEIAKKDFDTFGKDAFNFASPEFNLEAAKYSAEWMSWIVPGSLVAIGVVGKYFIADPFISRIYNNYYERPFRIPGKTITAKELHAHLDTSNQQFLQPNDVKALKHELIVRNKELDKKAEASVKVGAAMVLVVASLTAMGYSYGGYEVYVFTAGACTLITTVVNGYTYLSRAYLRRNIERNVAEMANNLNNLTRDCQQNVWSIIPGETLLTTQFCLITRGWKVTGYKSLPRYTVGQAIVNTLRTFGMSNVRTKTENDESKEIKDEFKKSYTAKLIVGADPALLDSMLNLRKLLEGNIGPRLNFYFKSSLERHSLLRLLDLQIFKLTRALQCEGTLSKIPGMDANKLARNTYTFLISKNDLSLVTLKKLKKTFPKCNVEFLADKLQVIINGYCPASKSTWQDFIDDIRQKKALNSNQVESKDPKVRTINVKSPTVAKSWNPLKRFNLFNRSAHHASVPTIKWNKVNATYPQDLTIRPVRRGDLYGRFFIRLSLPETAFPNSKIYNQAKLKIEEDPHFSQECLQSIEKSAGKLVRDSKGEWFLAAASITMIDIFYGTIKAYAEAFMSETSKEILYDVRGLEQRDANNLHKPR